MRNTLMLLISSGLILVILGISLSIGAKITQDISDDMTAGSYAKAVADNSTAAIGDLATWQSTISTVIAAVVIIGLLLSGFGAFLYFKQ